jgi:hypothetical protein
LFSAAEKPVDAQSSNLYYICIQKISQFGGEPILGIFFELWFQPFSAHLIFSNKKCDDFAFFQHSLLKIRDYSEKN